jgi:hypothetical protein
MPVGRLFLVGDAPHIVTHGREGINLALQDAAENVPDTGRTEPAEPRAVDIPPQGLIPGVSEATHRQPSCNLLQRA